MSAVKYGTPINTLVEEGPLNLLWFVIDKCTQIQKVCTPKALSSPHRECRIYRLVACEGRLHILCKFGM